jgi:hypothetical protein
MGMAQSIKIAIFSEGGYQGKVPRNHPNIRTDMAWVCSLDADHYPIFSLHQIPSNSYDLGIIIVPKRRRKWLAPSSGNEKLLQYPLIENIKRVCKKVSAMQEACLWYWQDDSIEEQIWYYNLLMEMDFLFVHNELDKKYFKGLTNKPCEILPSVLIPESIPKLSEVKDKDVIIGGNFVSIYSGFDSFIVAQEYSDDVWAPSMGRKKDNEESIVKHLPYMVWSEWMYELSRFKLAVFPTANVAAGQFALNCSYLGIPCVGYNSLDTQRILHPSLSVDHYNLNKAREKVIQLKNDPNFYNQCSQETKELFNAEYSEKSFIKKINQVLANENIINTAK